jgi:hypothetical protein
MKGILWAGFWRKLESIHEKAMTVRAIADVLSAAVQWPALGVDATELEPDTVRSLGMLLLYQVEAIFAALKSLAAWGKRGGQ